MGATNKTTNLELPQFIGTDKPSWLGDFNGAMNTIDVFAGTTTGSIGTVTATANAAKATADSAAADVAALGTTVAQHTTEISDTMADVSALEADVTNIKNEIAGISPLTLFSAPIEAHTAGGYSTQTEYNLTAILNGNKGLVTMYMGRNITSANGEGTLKALARLAHNPFNLPAQALTPNGTTYGINAYSTAAVLTTTINLNSATTINIWLIYNSTDDKTYIVSNTSASSGTFKTSTVTFPFIGDMVSTNWGVSI